MGVKGNFSRSRDVTLKSYLRAKKGSSPSCLLRVFGIKLGFSKIGNGFGSGLDLV